MPLLGQVGGIVPPSMMAFQQCRPALKERVIDLTKPGPARMYLTHEAKAHEIPVALGNTTVTGSINSTG